jgi:A/G-specific adenine glycosylase
MNYTQVANRLVSWHAPEQRALPWRHAAAGQRDPYAVWISEIMAQQTRLETVVAYFVRWMEQFPSVEALAAADQQSVLKAWEGLGYYARARNAHRAAQIIVSEHGGRIPDNREALLQLPGIGEYTAGAILSMAFGQAEPVLDGNVKRVLSRLADIEQPIDERATLKQLWSMATRLVQAAPAADAGRLNEALMELGATVCTPSNPKCLICPVAEGCTAQRRGTQQLRPVKSAPRRTPHYEVAAGVIWRGEPGQSQMLIAQRPQDAMLGGLWEFPGGKLEPEDADLQACLRREIAEELGIDIRVGEKLTVVQHAYTHFRITLHAFHAHHVEGEPQLLGCADWRWVARADLNHYPFPVTDQKIIAALDEALTAESSLVQHDGQEGSAASPSLFA